MNRKPESMYENISLCMFTALETAETKSNIALHKKLTFMFQKLTIRLS